MLFSAIKDIPANELNFDNIIYELQQIESANIWPVIDTIKHLKDLNIFSPSPTPLTDIIVPGKASILNLRGTDPKIASMIVAKLLKDIFIARKKAKIPPFFCVIEEAHNFVPEKGFGTAISSEIIRLISSEGRKFGLGLCVISQRPALLQKTVLAQCSTQIIMKITNPNDLRVITSSAEGIGSETADEIQNLPIGSALICGIVDRPLVVNIRRRRSKHGGEAVNVLQKYNSISASQEISLTPPSNNNKTPLVPMEQIQKTPQIKSTSTEPSIIEQTKNFANKNLISIVPSKLSIKDIKLIADKDIKKITTYLIPALYIKVSQEINKEEKIFHILVDKVKGKVILDPDTDKKIEINELANFQETAAFLRKPSFQEFQYNTIISERLSTKKIKLLLEPFCKVQDYTQTNIVFHKVEYT